MDEHDDCTATGYPFRFRTGARNAHLICMKYWSLFVLLCGCAVADCAQSKAATIEERGGRTSPEPGKVNRTIPRVEPPKSGLELSANLTTQEISRARDFQES